MYRNPSLTPFFINYRQLNPMNKKAITTTIQTLSDHIVKNWPLYSFVTSNPLAGLEDLPFESAIEDMRKYLNIKGYPSATAFEQAWSRGDINPDLLRNELSKKGIAITSEESLEMMHEWDRNANTQQELNEADRILIKWLNVFLDQGSTEWAMPYRNEGFYTAWKKNARYDRSMPRPDLINSLPDDPLELLLQITASEDEEVLKQLFKHHLLALPGWTGFIRYRMENSSDWQDYSPITLIDYLAVRLAICSQLDIEIFKNEIPSNIGAKEQDHMKSAWLSAMELTYRMNLTKKLNSQSKVPDISSEKQPSAQLVFCIDTRSERIRRSIEHVGNYETFGYAGFFGIAMEYHNPENNVRTKSCPPILDVQFTAKEKVRPEENESVASFKFYNSLQNAFREFTFTLRNNIPASFGYVESAGFFYGVSMILRTLLPGSVYRIGESAKNRKGRPESFNKANLTDVSSSKLEQLTDEQKTAIAKSAFELTGWEYFAPLVVFAGHGSQTANNAFGSSLDCGACAGNKGRHNARVLADICNERNVRILLAEHHDIHIPEDTLFIAAEHNTTSNDLEFFDNHIPKNKHEQINELKESLHTAQHLANLEQFDLTIANPKQTLDEAHRRTSDWAETRPEWGLAGNASFIIAPRDLTSNLDLEARSFLHSYDWEKDPTGERLEGILQGPMVVTQWINNHYYFASVDNETFGSGSKITHNVTGTYGVVQGNGGDLKSGLPLESLREDDEQLQHFPLRLSVYINAPLSRVQEIISKHPSSLGKLVKNKWIYLSVIDPTLGNEIIDLENATHLEVALN